MLKRETFTVEDEIEIEKFLKRTKHPLLLKHKNIFTAHVDKTPESPLKIASDTQICQTLAVSVKTTSSLIWINSRFYFSYRKNLVIIKKVQKFSWVRILSDKVLDTENFLSAKLYNNNKFYQLSRQPDESLEKMHRCSFHFSLCESFVDILITTEWNCWLDTLSGPSGRVSQVEWHTEQRLTDWGRGWLPSTSPKSNGRCRRVSLDLKLRRATFQSSSSGLT